MICIIDDDAHVSRGFHILLESAGYESESYANVTDFLQQCKPTKNDMLLLDLHMPGMNGCDLLKTFKKKGFKMPVIVITAYDSSSARDCARDYGVVAFMRKPVDGDALLDLIRFEYIVKQKTIQ